LRSGDQGGECKESDLPYMEGTPSRALIGGVCHSYGSGPPLAQRHIKRGTPGHGDQRSPCPQCPPQTLVSRSDPEGAEMRRTAHCAACHSCGSGPPLAQRHFKRGTPGHGDQRSLYPQCPPQTLVSRFDPEGAEARETAHCAAAIVVSYTPTPPTPTMTTTAVMSSSSSAQGISK
jgi:hypothetical protein